MTDPKRTPTIEEQIAYMQRRLPQMNTHVSDMTTAILSSLRSHDALVAALEAICNMWGRPANEPGPSLGELIENGRAALKATTHNQESVK